MSAKDKVGICILRVIPMVPSALFFIAPNDWISDLFSKRCFLMFVTSSDDGFIPAMLEFLICANAKRSDSKDGDGH